MSAMDAIHSGSSKIRGARVDAPRGLRARLGIATSAFAAAVADLLEKRRSRLALLSMTDEQLKDIGLSRADAEREGLRRPWE